MNRNHSLFRTAFAIGLVALLQACEGSTSGNSGNIFEQGKPTKEINKDNQVPPKGSPEDNIPRVPLRVLSYNTYHLPADRTSLATSEQRLAYLPDALVRTGADIIILQEVWTPVAQETIKSAMVTRGYQFYQNESRSAVPPFFLGNGLIVFAKNSIRPVGPVEFREWTKTAGFDDYASKGLIKVPLQVPGLGRVDVFNAHTSFLPWDGEKKNYDYTEGQTLMSQVTQLSDWVRSSTATVKILGADMNFNPFIWDVSSQRFDVNKKNQFYTKLTENFMDPFLQISPTCRYTCDTWDNQHNNLLAHGLFGDSSGGSMYDPEPNAKYDYVLYSGKNIKVARTGTAMQEEYPVIYKFETFNSPLSDHFAIATDLLVPKVQ
jgi:hypothetical protein